MSLFVIVAAAMAVILLVAGSQRPRLAVFVAAILWLLYACYEYLIVTGVLCDEKCNIRVDLVLFFPVLWIATFLAYRSYMRPPGPPTVARHGSRRNRPDHSRAAGGGLWLHRSGVGRGCGCAGHRRLCGQIEVHDQTAVTPSPEGELLH